MGNLNQDNTDGTAPLVELRHEAGLTAGLVMPLAAGAFQFGPLHGRSEGLGTGQPEAVSFELTVETADRVLAARGTEPLAIEGRPVTDPVEVRPGEVIQLPTDHFTIEKRILDAASDAPSPLRVPPLPAIEAAEDNRLGPILGVVTIVGLALSIAWVGFLSLAVAGAVGLFFVALQRYLQSNRIENERAMMRSAVEASFIADLQQARSAAARTLRDAGPGPAGISDLVAGRRPRADDFDGQVSVASGDLGWSPTIDDRADSGWNHETIVSRFDFLPAVPFTVDIGRDTIGIVGPRQSTLAAARHLVTATLAMAGRSELRATVTATEPHRTDWRWLGNLGLPDLVGQPAFEIQLFDGVIPSRRSPGAVILAESVDDLGVDCDTTLIIGDDGTARAELSAGGSATGLVPHGITEAHAQSIAVSLARIGRDVETADADMSLGATATETATRNGDLVIDLRDHAGTSAFLGERLMVVAEPGEQVTALVATSALEHAAVHPDCPIFVLDRGDRALIRLAQLPSCHRYVAIDDLVATAEMIQQIEELVAFDRADTAILIVSDLGRVLDFYRHAGVPELANRLESLLDQPTNLVNTTASTGPGMHGLESLAERFRVWVFASADEPGATQGLRVVDEHGEHRVEESTLAGRDLTGSVAAFVFGRIYAESES